MGSPFNTQPPPRAVTDHTGRLTLVNGRTFTVADRTGQLTSAWHGTVFEDRRMLSRLTIDVGDRTGDIECELLASSTPTPFEASVVTRPSWNPHHPGRPSPLVVVHRQWVGRGVRHDIEVHNTSPEQLTVPVAARFDTDFAHIFDVKNGVASPGASTFTWHGDHGELHEVNARPTAQLVWVRVAPEPAQIDAMAKEFSWTVDCASRSTVIVSVTFEPVWDGVHAGELFPLDSPPGRAVPAQRLEHWRRHVPRVDATDQRLTAAFDKGLADLASLRIFDPQHPDRTVIAAGAPWFMTLFGRDSLLTSWMMLPFVPELAVGVLHALAELQGTRVRPASEEEPGKIIHELRRHGGDDAFASRGRYYGTIDATPLFVMVAAEAQRWHHLSGEELLGLWPAIRAAIDWVSRHINNDADGWLRYERSTGTGLINQGWKDSWDGITFADGRIPTGPIALSEVQGYAYAALRSGARLARLIDDDTAGVDPDGLDAQAEQLRERFNHTFWDERSSSFALGVADGGALIDAVTTNPGHAIWAGITDDDLANRYLDRILDDDLFTGWGLRTLSPSCAAYDPLSYHNGSVWPHDTALVTAGAAMLRRDDAVSTLLHAALDMADRTHGRPPELFAGIAREVIDTPVAYPDSCSPQAWSSASTLLNVRSLLDLHPPRSADAAPATRAMSSSSEFGIRSITGVHVGRTVHTLTPSAPIRRHHHR